MSSILITSIPKSGTHLLINILGRALREEPRYLSKDEDFSKLGRGIFYGHIRAHQALNFESEKWKVVCLIRDPRDIMLSIRDYLKVDRIRGKFREGRHHYATLSPDEQLRYLVRNTGPRVEFVPITKHCSGFIEWRDRGALIVKYQDVISGKADYPLARFLSIDPHKVEKFRGKLVGSPTKTFNVGIVNRWRTEMSEDVLAHFHHHFDYGYLRKLGFTAPLRYTPPGLWIRSQYQRLTSHIG